MVFTTYCSKSQAQPGSHYFFHVHGGGVSFFIGCGLLPTPEVIQSNAPSCSARLTLSVERTGESPPRLQSNYRWPFGPPGPALARARPGPLLAVPCLARPNLKSGRAVPAHGLYQRPKHGPAGLFRAGPARWNPAL